MSKLLNSKGIPIEPAFNIITVIPFNTKDIPKVAINDGTPNPALIIPFIAPQIIPISKATGSVIAMFVFDAFAATAPAIPTIAPIEKSKLPCDIKNNTPDAPIITLKTSFKSTILFLCERSLPPLVT